MIPQTELSRFSNPEAEHGVLVGLLVQPELLRKMPWLKATDFASERCGEIFRAYVEAVKTGDPLDPAHIGEQLRKRGRAGLMEHLVLMYEEPPGDTFGYARIVYKNAQERRLRSRVTDLAGNERLDLDELQDALAREVRAAAEHASDNTSNSRVRTWDAFRQQKSFRFRMSGWLPTKGVAVLGAAEHTGKSTIAVDWALRCVLGPTCPDWCGHTVRAPCSSLYVIGEDPLGIKLRVEAFAKERVGGKFGQQFADTLTCEGRTINFVDRLQVPLCDPEGIRSLRQDLDVFHCNYGHYPGIVWLDTSSTLYCGDEKDNTAMGRFARALSELADEYDLLVVLIHHLRKPDTTNRKQDSARPTAADLRGAGAMAADFDVVMLLWRPTPDDRLSPVEVVMNKGKNGGTTGSSHWLAPTWISLEVNDDGDDVGAPILRPCNDPTTVDADELHARESRRIEALALRMLTKMRDKDTPDSYPTPTTAQDLVPGATGAKRKAWNRLVSQGWVVRTGTARAGSWRVSETAPEPDDPRFSALDEDQ